MKSRILSTTLLSLFLSVLILPTLSLADTPYFSDVTDDYVYHHSINFLKSENIISGYEDGTYMPNDYLTRATGAKMVLAAYAANTTIHLDIEEVDPSDTFADIQSSDWYAKYLVKAENLGIWGRDSDGRFNPQKPLSRAEFMKLLLVPSGINLDSLQNTQLFSDVPKGVWFTKYMNYAGKYSIISPDRDNNLYPSQYISRGEAADWEYIIHLMTNSADTDMILAELKANIDEVFEAMQSGSLLGGKRNASFAVGLGQMLYNRAPTDPVFLSNAKLAKAVSYTLNAKISGDKLNNDTQAASWMTLARSKLAEAQAIVSSDINAQADELQTFWAD